MHSALLMEPPTVACCRVGLGLGLCCLGLSRVLTQIWDRWPPTAAHPIPIAIEVGANGRSLNKRVCACVRVLRIATVGPETTATSCALPVL